MSAPLFQSAPTNPILRQAYQRLGLLPPEEEPKGGTDAMKQLRGKQDWKLMSKIPGTHSGNTWQAMSMAKQLTAPVNKTAAVQGVVNAAKAVGSAIKAHPVRTGLLGATAVAAPPTVGYVRDVAGSLKNTIRNNEQATADRAALMKSGREALQPFADMVRQFGSGMAGLFGSQGYAPPQWYQRLREYLSKAFNKFTDPETGPGGVNVPTTNKEGEMTMLSTVDAVGIALNGSDTFQKRASAGTEIVPDTVLNAHLMLANEMEKAAEVLATREKGAPFIPALKAAAADVRRGYPARASVYRHLGSRKLAETLYPVVEAAGYAVVEGAVNKTLQRKKAEYLAAKKVPAGSR